MALRSIEAELEEIARDYRLPRATDLEATFQPTAESLSLSSRRGEGKGESKAVAGAMRALQDKIKALETANSALRLDLQDAQVRWQDAQNSLRTLSETQKSQESTLFLQVQNLEEALLRERNVRRDREQTLNDLRESTACENEDLREQVKSLARQIEQKGREIVLFERNLDAIEKERTRFLTENSDLKAKVARLGTEIAVLRQGTDQSRINLVAEVTETEERLRKQLEESQAKASDLEQSVSGLKALLAQKDSALREKLTSPKKSARKQHKKRISAHISQLESELSDRSAAYKLLLQQAETMDLSQLRTSLNSLSQEIDSKSKELARAKRSVEA